uniref:Large ribosomal subunit protein eL28 n=1 Tax=Moina brachiata TaxID=675436 RepID=A0A4Y7NJH5_9CRUS|nr:EOG090X0JNN [Moina brachiata]
MSSAQLQWLITRKTSCFAVKKRNIKQPFSMEPLHLTNRHSYKYNTLIHKNVIGVEPAKDKNGFVVVQKRQSKLFKPKQSLQRQQIKSGPRHTLAKLRNIVTKGGYRKDCRQAVLKRASAIIRSEKVRTPKKGAKVAKKTE